VITIGARPDAAAPAATPRRHHHRRRRQLRLALNSRPREQLGYTYGIYASVWRGN
jgi:hypothetical protein